MLISSKKSDDLTGSDQQMKGIQFDISDDIEQE
jgi:hypothetical protein